MRACKSEDLPAVPDAPRPAAHRLVEWAFGRTCCGYVLEVRTATGSAARPRAVTNPVD